MWPWAIPALCSLTSPTAPSSLPRTGVRILSLAVLSLALRFVLGIQRQAEIAQVPPS